MLQALNNAFRCQQESLHNCGFVSCGCPLLTVTGTTSLYVLSLLLLLMLLLLLLLCLLILQNSPVYSSTLAASVNGNPNHHHCSHHLQYFTSGSLCRGLFLGYRASPTETLPDNADNRHQGWVCQRQRRRSFSILQGRLHGGNQLCRGCPCLLRAVQSLLQRADGVLLPYSRPNHTQLPRPGCRHTVQERHLLHYT